jgi:hypothetical protein
MAIAIATDHPLLPAKTRLLLLFDPSFLFFWEAFSSSRSAAAAAGGEKYEQQVGPAQLHRMIWLANLVDL